MKLITYVLGGVKFRSLSLLMLASIFYLAFFDHYPRVGWADAAIYNSYVIVADSYRYIEGFGEALNGATYQGSRLGYIVPLRFLSAFMSAAEARFVFNFFLFIIYSVSVIKFIEVSVNNSIGKILVIGFLLLNPQVVSAIVFGGADGPSMIYSVVSLVFLFFAVREINKWLFVFSGLFFGLAISSHVFSLVPYFIVLIAFGFSNYLSGRQIIRVYWPHLLWFAFGFVAIVFALGVIGNQLGLKDFYLSYSFGRIEKSIQGSGVRFSVPFVLALKYGALWGGILLLLACVLIFGGRDLAGRENKIRLLNAKIAFFNFAIPLIFVFVFDFLIGGSLITSPHYFNAFFPSFVFGSVFFLASWDRLEGNVYKKTSFLIVALFLFFSSIQIPNNERLFSASDSSNKDLIISQQALDSELSKFFHRKVFNLIYPKTANVDLSAGKYVDYFAGKMRVFDYLDSLAYTFPWVGGRTYRIDLVNSGVVDLNLKIDVPTVILGKTESQVDEILAKILRKTENSEIRKCGGDGVYQWCIAIIKKRLQGLPLGTGSAALMP